MKFCLDNIHNTFGGDDDATLWIDVDEKNFCSLSQRIVYVPSEFEKDFKFQHAESKTNIEGVMFFAAVARPRPKYEFDGCVLLLPVCEKKIRKRKGKYGQKGDYFYVKVNEFFFMNIYFSEHLTGNYEQSTLPSLSQGISSSIHSKDCISAH